ncbi:Phage-related protein [uncultured Butyricicoccus sp.]|uniref:Type II toxin-antitoxin system RelE/ParE family toxin n=1 Tax=Agathobaculum ammoniilyticum TaxID=2981778 RepID=A0ABT2U6A6_9FIRM|nr:type II toxin-antitoxin system RelE/ParE family toxin [Agathobaculum ammoniilyticum]MBS6884278.1 type II toxin-antitoxin system RelE/ParE family toxin [Clostridiaceae bacterium]MCU6790157.1 type II toxin-antitoxin system RelE/ParE family toxin [Agathobaculum ammoniilyticum]SCJ52363.1 Phage-related protein [uncultured Butyricicoccus sp.]
MKKLYLYRDAGSIPVDQFLRTLPDSQRVHLLWQIAKLLLPPDMAGKAPVKHFQMERYRGLYEVRDKLHDTLTRIIFTYSVSGDVILLEAFIKKHKRTTEASLASALAKLRRVELDPAQFLLEVPSSTYLTSLL